MANIGLPLPNFDESSCSGTNFEHWKARVKAYCALAFKNDQNSSLNLLKLLSTSKTYTLLANASSSFESALGRLEKRFGLSKEKTCIGLMKDIGNFRPYPDERLGDCLVRLECLTNKAVKNDLPISDEMMIQMIKSVVPYSLHSCVVLEENQEVFDLLNTLIEDYGYLPPARGVERMDNKPHRSTVQRTERNTNRPSERNPNQQFHQRPIKERKCFKCGEPWNTNHTCVKVENNHRIESVKEAEVVVDSGAAVNVFGRDLIPYCAKTGNVRRIKTIHSKPTTLQEGKLTITDNDLNMFTLTGAMDPQVTKSLLRPPALQYNAESGSARFDKITIPVKLKDDCWTGPIQVLGNVKELDEAGVLKLLNVDPQSLADYKIEECLVKFPS